MPKVVIKIKDNKDNLTCKANVEIIGLDKSTDTEKNATITIYNAVLQTLENLK